MTKKEYIKQVLGEIERVANLAVDEGKDGQMHPLELVAFIFESYCMKVLQHQMTQTLKSNLPVEDTRQEEQKPSEETTAKVIPLPEAKDKKPTFH